MLDNVKLCVYAICKNEEKFVERWLKSVDEADYIAVLDTGSIDNTKNIFEEYSEKNPGKLIFKSFDYGDNFRFDRARNDSLKLVPFDTDVCIVLDLDHIPEKGWSKIVKNHYINNELVTGYIIDHDKDGKENNRWRSKNVHPNSPYYIWTKPIHEGIHYIGEDKKYEECFDENFIIDHYPDTTKDRSLYITLLRKAVEEDPTDPYFVNYLGVELSKNSSIDEAIEVYKKGIEVCVFDKNDNFLLFQMYINLGSLLVDKDPATALNYYEDAEDMNIKTRRLYVYIADVYKKVDDINMEIFYLIKALKEVKSYSHDWRDDFDYFNGVIEDRLALLYYYEKKDYILAMKYGAEALSYQPENERMKGNLDYFYKAYKECNKNE
jgi:tetratricopeptide (TPR) repeat protein